MKIPDKVRIDGVDYEVIHKENLNNGERLLLGEIDYVQSEIRLKHGQSNQYACVTLLHEILHGIAHHKKLDLGKNEENIIDGFAFGIYQVLQDNARKLYDICEDKEEV